MNLAFRKIGGFMNNEDIEKLPNLVKSGKISITEAVNVIWEDIYTKPYYYGLGYFTDDQRSEFLIEIHDLLEKLFAKFNGGALSFRAFVAGCIANNKMSFLRTQFSKSTEDRSMVGFLKTRGEEESEKYENGFENIEAYEKQEAKVKKFSDIIEQETTDRKKRDKRIAEVTTLVLALKACKDLDDDMVCKVSDFTEIDKEVLYDKLQELKKSMGTREKNHQKIVRKRNNAFFYHRKYMEEMISPDTSEKKLARLRQKYEIQTKKWEDSNKILSEFSQSPSNDEIAKAIGLKPRMVSFYINHARKAENRKRIHDMYEKKKETVMQMKFTENDEAGLLKIAENDEAEFIKVAKKKEKQ